MEFDNELPLTGVKVIEMGQIAAGPFTGMLLADLGADVIKVERPDGGDGMRSWPPLLENESGEEYSGNFASLNRNKRSITIDLKDESDLNKLTRLCEVADIFLENYRPGVLSRFNLDYESLKEINPSLVYCSISGYGQSGPYANKGAFDVTVQAISGLMSVTGEEEGAPVKCGVPVGDFVTALYAAYSIMVCFHNATLKGYGTYIDCSMLGSMLGISALQTSEYYGNNIPPKRLGSAHPRNAPYQAYSAQDKSFVIAAGNGRLWKKVCDIIDYQSLADERKFKTQSLRAKNQKELTSILQPIFLKRKADEWLKDFDDAGVPCAPINTFEDVLQDEHVIQMDLIGESYLPNGRMINDIGFPIKMYGYQFNQFRRPPKLGEHNNEVWSEWMESKKIER